MALVQTINRLIKVEESYDEIYDRMDLNWFELTEDTSYRYDEFKTKKKDDGYYAEFQTKKKDGKRKIRLNRSHIVEIIDN